MSVCTTKSCKYQKIDWENEQKRWFLRKQRKKDNFWDEYEKPCLVSSFDKSRFENFSLDGTSSEEDNMNKVNIKEDNTYEGLGDNDNRRI